MGEKTAYNHLRTHLPLDPKDRFERVENLVTPGTPDVNYCFSGVEGWIECKAPREPKRESTPLFGSSHRVLMSQRNWIKMQVQAGGIAWVYMRSENHAMLIDGKYADEINGMALKALISISSWHSSLPVTKHKWTLLKRILRMEESS